MCYDKKLNPIDIRKNTGNESDIKIGKEIVQIIEADEFAADTGYDSNCIRNIIKKKGSIQINIYIKSFLIFLILIGFCNRHLSFKESLIISFDLKTIFVFL